MKQAEHTNWKATFDIRRRPINAKLFQNQKIPIQQLAAKKSMGKKYMQEPNIFKQKFQQPKKQHRQIVMSEQFIRSSKIYRLLKQKMDRCDSMYMKQVNSLNEQKLKLKQDIMGLKSQNYQQKIELWELKNKLMELKTMYHEQQEQSQRLGEANYEEYEGEMQEGEDHIEERDQNQQQRQNGEYYSDTGSEQNDRKNEQIRNSIPQSASFDKFSNHVEDKNQFSEILQELMSLKAQRHRMEKEFSQKQVGMTEKESSSFSQSNEQHSENNLEDN